MLNLTQHTVTTEQIAAGVIEPTSKQAIQSLLTFDTVPTIEEIRQRAEALATIAAEELKAFRLFGRSAMVGGAPYLMGPLETALARVGIAPYYAFSARESTERTEPDGSVVKTQVFRHAGFIKAEPTVCNFAAVYHGCGYA